MILALLALVFVPGQGSFSERYDRTEAMARSLCVKEGMPVGEVSRILQPAKFTPMFGSATITIALYECGVMVIYDNDMRVQSVSCGNKVIDWSRRLIR